MPPPLLPRRGFLSAATASGGAVTAAMPGPAAAQQPPTAPGFPSRPVRVVIAFPPGGGTDNLARIIEAHVGRALGQPMVIENRPSAGGIVAASHVAKAEPDGHTLLMTDSSYTIVPSLFPRLPYDPVRDLAPVSLLASGPVILLCHPSVPARTLQELVALAKARPGTLSFASGGNGATTHLAGELLKIEAGIDLIHVPHRGTGPATNDLIAGHVPLMFNGISASRPHVLEGRLRALAVTGERRAPALPDVPTFAEAGLPGVDASTFWHALAPAATPEPLRIRLAEGFAAGVHQPEAAARLRDLGFVPIGGGPAAHAANLSSEMAKWARVVRAAGVRAD